ncbi:ATP-dependent nuclease [Rhizobium sp. No.120]
MISEISIKNFRSISSAVVKGGRITTLVGSNDAGKSNVLRALNLFFNGTTGHDEPFDFAKDYNLYAKKRSKKAGEIEIKLTFTLPKSYQRDDLPTKVEWKKVWREEGEVDRLRSFSYVGGAEIPARSKVPALIYRVLYTYIPAIKDQDFFADLQGRLYDVLSDVAAEPLKNSASNFESQLQIQLGELLQSLETIFKGRALMKLPENLREIFENLEISSGDIPLSRRGDGIKIRNIPMILRFISEKQDQILNRGGVRYTHIWGFEEPENNVEMSAAFSMAQDMYDTVAGRENLQLFMTTHSPIFYKMPSPEDNGNAGISTNFVERIDNETLIVNKNADEVDITMGLMPLLAPYLEDAKKRHDELQSQLKTAHELAALKVPTIFVEGPTDVQVFKKAWSLFGDPNMKLHVNDGGNVGYGSANALASRSLAWLLEMRHRAKDDIVPAVSIFDADEAGKNAKRELSENIASLGIRTNLKFTSQTYPQIESVRALNQQGFVLYADLESTYSDKLWLLAEKQGWLEDFDNVGTRLRLEVLQSVLNNDLANPLDGLIGVERLRVRRRFSDAGKVKIAKHIDKLNDADATAALIGLKQWIEKTHACLAS